MKKLGFDYSAIDVSTGTFLHERADRIHNLARQTRQGIVEIGRCLTEVKERLPHGEFTSWVKAEFDWTIRSAQAFMMVYREFKSENFSHLRIDISALYRIASPKTPEPVRADIMRRAESGERITHAAVKTSVAAFAATNNLPVSSEPPKRAVAYVEPHLAQPKPIVVLASVTDEPREPLRVLVTLQDAAPKPGNSLGNLSAAEPGEDPAASIADEVEQAQNPSHSRDIDSQESITDYDRVRPIVEFLLSFRKPLHPEEAVEMLRARGWNSSISHAGVLYASDWLIRFGKAMLMQPE